jgi:hypothetical protein
MQATGVCDFWQKQILQFEIADLFVPGVHPLPGDIFSQLVAKMAKIVQQRGGDNYGGFVGRLRKAGALQGMLQFGDFFPVMPVSLFAVNIENFC